MSFEKFLGEYYSPLTVDAEETLSVPNGRAVRIPRARWRGVVSRRQRASGAAPATLPGWRSAPRLSFMWISGADRWSWRYTKRR
jgi:hypothetical protein